MHVIQQKTGHTSEGGCGHHHAEGESCFSHSLKLKVQLQKVSNYHLLWMRLETTQAQG